MHEQKNLLYHSKVISTKLPHILAGDQIFKWADYKGHTFLTTTSLLAIKYIEFIESLPEDQEIKGFFFREIMQGMN